MSDDVPELQVFDGKRTNWRTFKKQRNGFKKLNKNFFKGYAGVRDPKKRDRVTVAYTVADDEENDPTGAEPGDRVQAESIQQKKKKEKKWHEIDELWYHVQYNAVRGKARSIADEMTTESGKELEEKINAHYEGTSSSHAAYNLINWVQDKRPAKQSVDEFSEKWDEQRKVVEANLDWSQITCLLFLRALGPKYRSFMDIQCAKEKKLDLHDLMSKAADHRRGEEDDEAELDVAMAAAEQQTEQTKSKVAPRNDDYLRPCAICGNKFHCKAECFKPGGGLAHLSPEERRGWLDAQRTQREQRRQQREQREAQHGGHHKQPHSQPSQPVSENANVAAQLVAENMKLNAKIQKARHQIASCGFAIDVDL